VEEAVVVEQTRHYGHYHTPRSNLEWLVPNANRQVHSPTRLERWRQLRSVGAAEVRAAQHQQRAGRHDDEAAAVVVVVVAEEELVAEVVDVGQEAEEEVSS